jgi:hypothetical protein
MAHILVTTTLLPSAQHMGCSCMETGVHHPLPLPLPPREGENLSQLFLESALCLSFASVVSLIEAKVREF